jgi:hypothetical protein
VRVSMAMIGEHRDGVAAIEALPVPLRRCGIGSDRGVLTRDSLRGTNDAGAPGRGEIPTVGPEKAKPAPTAGADRERAVVMPSVMALAQQDQVVEIGAAAVQPVPDVMSLQATCVGAPRMPAVPVVSDQESAILPVGHQPVRAPHVEHVRAVVQHGANPAGTHEPLCHVIR